MARRGQETQARHGIGHVRAVAGNRSNMARLRLGRGLVGPPKARTTLGHGTPLGGKGLLLVFDFFRRRGMARQRWARLGCAGKAEHGKARRGQLTRPTPGRATQFIQELSNYEWRSHQGRHR